MIVFWRLLAAYYIGAILFYNRCFFAWRDKHPVPAYLLQGLVFVGLTSLLCAPYLSMDWRLAEQWTFHGMTAVVVLSLLYVLINHLFVFRTHQTHGYTCVFLLHEIAILAAILACSPLHIVYHTGNLMAEPITVFLVGALVVTKMFSVFIYMVEQDLYGRDYPTLDESFVTMLMRLIFFLMVLLPGWRWLLWFGIWFWACLVARKNRLMDLSHFAFYFSIFGAAIIGFAVRFSWYWH